MKIDMKKTLLSLGCLATLGVATSSFANSYGFTQITANGGAAGVAAQLSVGVTNAGGGQVSFTFHNVGSLASSITDVYFDDGTLLGIASINSTAGVSFNDPANPQSLPGGNSVNPPFVTTQDFSADSDPPAQPNGVNATTDDLETLTIIFNLINEKTYDDTIAALFDGTLRIGLHVQGYSNGASEGFINTPPDGSVVQVPDGGSTIAMLGFALLGAGALRRKLLKK
jgi:hypothetical protein